MKHAFEKAGLKKEDMAFYVHAVKYFESGGTYERGIALYKQAAEKTGKVGLTNHVGTDQHPIAQLPQPIPSEGQLAVVQSDQAEHADARSQLPEGHIHVVQQGHISSANGQPKASEEALAAVPVKATGITPPARDPDDAFRRALTRDRIQNATIWLELNRTSDGRAWSKVCPSEFSGMERDARTVHHIKFVFGEFNQKQMHTPLGKLMPAYLQEKLANRVKLMESRHA